MKRIIVFLFLLLLLGATEASAQCTPTGGYPWLTQSCLHASDLNKLGSLFKGPVPPHNTNNLGALQGTLWEDDSVTPHAIRYCNASACSPTYVSTEWQTWGTVDSSGNLSITISPTAVTSSLGYVPLNPASNLTEVVNKATARTNLGLNSAALQPSSAFLQGTNNLSDLPNTATARTNLGLGSSATHPAIDFLQGLNNLSDISNVATARLNLGLGTAATHLATDFTNNIPQGATTASALSKLISRIALTPYDFGAVGDGIANDTAALSAWLAAIPDGGWGYLPCGSFLVTGVGAEIFLITNKKISLAGAGRCAQVVTASSVPSTTRVFHFTAAGTVSNPAGIYDNMRFMDFRISAQGSPTGAGLWFQALDNTGRFRDIVIERLTIENTIGHSTEVALKAEAPGTPGVVGGSGNGILVHSRIQDNLLWNGMECFICGDSIDVQNNLMPGSTTGRIAITQLDTAGQAGLRLAHNNISVAAGVWINGAIACDIRDNEFEQQATNIINLGGNHALLDIGPNSSGCHLSGGNASALAGTGNPWPVLIESDNTTIDPMWLYAADGISPIRIAATADNTIVNPTNTLFSSANPLVDDQGTNTRNFNAMAPGKYPGTKTNDNASIGDVGEYVNGATPSQTGTVTISISSPAVITWANHGLAPGGVVRFSTTGALPTGLTAGTVYYIAGFVDNDTFRISTTPFGTLVNTSGTQSGTQTATTGVSPASDTSVNAAVAQLSGGDWEVSGSCYITQSSAGILTSIWAAVSLNSSSVPSITSGREGVQVIGNPATETRPTLSVPTGPLRVKVAVGGTQNVHIVCVGVFGSGTIVVFGQIRARRVR